METKFELLDLLVKIGIPKQFVGDIFFLLFFLVAGVILILLVKKKNLGAFSMSAYLAYVIFNFSYFIPKTATVGIFYFALLLFIVFILMKKIVAFHIGGGQISIIIKSILIAILTCGMITSFILSWLPKENLAEFFTPFAKRIFTTDTFRFGWAVVPFIFLSFIKKYRY